VRVSSTPAEFINWWSLINLMVNPGKKNFAFPGAVAKASGRKMPVVEPVLAIWLLAPSISDT
jgi:hypothetical protein